MLHLQQLYLNLFDNYSASSFNQSDIKGLKKASY